MAWHPGWSFVIEALVAGGTLSLAGVTFVLATRTQGMETQTKKMAEATKTAAEAQGEAIALSVRPFLADPSPRGFTSIDEELLFGAPGRISVRVQRGTFWSDDSDDGGIDHFSLAFENVGTGVAAIVDARTDPSFPGDVYVSRKFVPVGSLVRVNVSVLKHLSGTGTERFSTHWWAMDGISVIIEYTDTNGGDATSSRAEIRQYATQAPFVQEIIVSRLSDGMPLAIGKSSY